MFFEIFHVINPSGRTMTLGSTNPLRAISTGISSGGLRQPMRKADNLATFMCPLSEYPGKPQHPVAFELSLGLYRDGFTFTLIK
jgi:hypothetical protein